MSYDYDYGDAIFNEATEEAGGYVVWMGASGTFYEEEVRACEAYDDLTEGMTDEEILLMEIGMEVMPKSEVNRLYWDRAISVVE
jgi:adenosyl cobinamide kinase/adenosyl cobinamide phosphate guanylyltransferase